MDVRNRYFRLVDLLRATPQEKYFEFDPRDVPHASADNTGNLHAEQFDDWGAYRSSAKMLKRGIDLLNNYYYLWMTDIFRVRHSINQLANGELEMILKILENLGGVLGLRPMMWPYVRPSRLRQQADKARRRATLES